jgi:hypothetical protein
MPPTSGGRIESSDWSTAMAPTGGAELGPGEAELEAPAVAATEPTGDGPGV